MTELPLLISYVYRNGIDWNIIRAASKDLDLLVDSGAFTAFKQGKAVQREDYQTWLENLGVPCRYFQLDVIGDTAKTWEHLKDMYADGFDPIPIFTRGENIEHLPELYGYNSIVGLGGIQMKSDNSPGYVKWFMRQNQGRETHLLGFADHSFLVGLKPTSADASNWATTLMWGNILLWQQGKFQRIDRRNWHRYSAAIDALGFDSGILADPQAWVNTLVGNGCYAQRITAASYLNYIEMLRKRVGTKLYLVITDKREFDLLYQLFLERNKK